jgi:hypothetical protein
VESAGVVDLIDKAWKVGGDIFEDFRVFMKLSALALS